MHLLPSVRRKHPRQCLPELRRSFLFPAYSAEPQLERRRLSRRVSGKHNRQASSRGFARSQAIRRSNQINPTGTAMTPKRHKFSARVFLGAGIYGVVVLLPQYFLEEKLARDFPPPLTHPEHFYGFIGVALAWQFVFLIIAGDVLRYRLFMVPATLEKLSFGVAALVLYAQGRVAAFVAGAGIIDLLFAVLFVLAFRASPSLET